ncbi:hypothetical protein [Dyella telluris]|uniref:Uncharacterized protein n=1 Tax=Dyella telluris TaxID=2763498 RepID=A0A7G8Q015_9GAMM|nr:hypothetical protein [Dyella telluris]QNK00123.1 hypothetical protein H8F01_13420 [Dyella telluris]
MSQQQWASVTLGMMVGLGVARVLTSVAASVRSRDLGRPDWIPLVWAACIFLLELQQWWDLQNALQAVDPWSFTVFLMLLVPPLLLYSAAVMILPINELRNGEDSRELFERHGHWALLVISVYYLEMVCENALYWKANPLSFWTGVQFTLAALPLIAFFSPRKLHGAIAILFLVTVLILVFFF